MQRTFGAMPGGGILYVYRFSPEEFGSIGARSILSIVADIKRDRRQAFKQIREMLKAFRLVQEGEEVQSISIGSDKLGNEQLVVVAIVPGGPK
jgi:hypothetical protein